jgi:hypothetical protein
MARSIPNSILTALSQPDVSPFYAVEMMFDTAPLRLWTGYGDRLIGINTYLGVGTLMTISGLDEAGDLSAKSASITMSGIDNAIVSLALAEPYQRRICRIYFGVIGSADIVEVFSGYMNVMTIEDSGETSVISLAIESKLVELNRARVRRYTHESHQSRYAGDTFFSYVADLQDKSIVWGRKEA